MKKSNNNPATMNPEEFEAHLKQKAIRSMPEEWRTGILEAAHAAANESRSGTWTTTPAPWRWSDLFWPCPQAWAGLAAVWIVLAVFNHTTVSPAVETFATAKEPVITPEFKLAYQEQQRELAQLLKSFDDVVAEPPKPFVPRPRSEFRAQIGTA